MRLLGRLYLGKAIQVIALHFKYENNIAKGKYNGKDYTY